MNLKNRHFLKLLDFTQAEIQYLIDLAAELKAAKKAGCEQQKMKGKNIALIFEKTSTRTRCAFEVAARDQGAGVTYLEPSGSQIGHKESIKDTARVLGRMYDAIEYRGFGQEIVEALAQHAGVPVFNGLTNEYHPTQMLADALTMQEHSRKPLSQTAYAYVGDARYNMGNSLLILGAKLGMDVRIGAPKTLWPSENIIAEARKIAAESGAKILLTEDPQAAVAGVDFIHTDVWVSMGEPKEVWQERIELLKPYRVTPELMAASGNPDVKFMHCLPAFHNRETTVGEWIYQTFGLNGVEVTEDVFESPASIVFDQAENRMHTIKAVMVAALGG
ncbi:ornithine carbamoyltransferase [Neisseria sp. ZJ106]|uniref:Ornithine carbamoyltransferase n=1 Tax=Neisseria lisongii TaxID=2912188 RepID=A0ABY7RKH6_9NEIS|nr:ornithine carbamoyltransferase [Neisseria lisongii]MCF7521226.1 ornithine carbamoyltransferase [Neisseria lisongii]WCL71718.1 ornithine carbamoyltransferase [Neisseria lisongii]